MKIYLAGGITGNLITLWKAVMKVFLAGTYSRSWIIEEAMKVYLAGGNEGNKWKGDFDKDIQNTKPYILESFYYVRTHNEWLLKLRSFFKDFLLDSGAFTFMNTANIDKPDFNKYVEEYAAFIIKHKVDLFFELDIDSVVGLQEVERLRAKLEAMTGKQSIPVWHKSRGLAYWKKMTEQYDYVAIGGIVTGEIKRKEYDIFKPLLKIARQNKCKVHGLGFTNLKGLHKYKFYSVDSTAWLYGNRGGFLYQFNKNKLDKIHPKGLRLKGREAALHNFIQWIKFSRYAENNL